MGEITPERESKFEELLENGITVPHFVKPERAETPAIWVFNAFKSLLEANGAPTEKAYHDDALVSSNHGQAPFVVVRNIYRGIGDDELPARHRLLASWQKRAQRASHIQDTDKRRAARTKLDQELTFVNTQGVQGVEDYLLFVSAKRDEATSAALGRFSILTAFMAASRTYHLGNERQQYNLLPEKKGDFEAFAYRGPSDIERTNAWLRGRNLQGGWLSAPQAASKLTRKLNATPKRAGTA